MPSLLAEVARLEELLSEARAGSSQFRTIETLHDEIARLQKALASKARKDATGPLSRENVRLRKSERTAQMARSRESEGATPKRGRPHRVLFTRTADLVQRMKIARRERALEAMLARLDRYHLLILDDIAHVQKDQAETSVLFELI